MRIGILTFNYCHNYGAMLQAYAMRMVLTKMGGDVYFVDYQLPHLAKRYNLFPSYGYKGKSLKVKLTFIKTILLNLRRRLRKIRSFKSFEKSNFQTISINNIQILDLIVVGSDQVWNPTITEGYNRIYYGGLVEKGIKHISYAASTPAQYITDDIKNLLNNFYSIGVREVPTYNKLKEMGYKPYLNIDPTLLLTASDYASVSKKYRKGYDDYVMVYDVSGNSLSYQVAEQIANIKRLKILRSTSTKKKVNSISYNDAGPQEFLSIIENAKYTIVSSFHGTAFSIIYHKKFVYIPFNNEKDQRSLTLLHSLGLECCVYKELFNFNNVENINWNTVDEKLKVLRKSSLEYLSNQFSEILQHVNDCGHC